MTDACALVPEGPRGLRANDATTCVVTACFLSSVAARSANFFLTPSLERAPERRIQRRSCVQFHRIGLRKDKSHRGPVAIAPFPQRRRGLGVQFSQEATWKQ